MIRSTPLIVLLTAAAVLAAACAPDDEDDPAEPEAIVVTATPVPVEIDDSLPDEPTPTPEPAPEPTPTPPEARAPTDGDRARFIADYDPGGVSSGRQFAADITGDGTREIVFAWVVDGERRSRVDVAVWTGTAYEIATRELGGPAERLEELRPSDLTGDGRTEIVVVQTVGTHGRSATLWRAGEGGALEPLRGVGDCFDGSHTYGDADVQIADRTGDGRAEVRAVCEEPDRPRDLWPTVVYEWEDDAYRCSHRREADGTRTECT